MTDPVGIAGTVTGLVSLGLQVYGGVTEYLDAIEARKEDISAAARRAEILRVAIDGIRGASSKIGPKYDLTRSAVTAGIWSCKTELQSLSNLIAELRPSMPPINLQEKLKEGAKKLHYPFRRRDLLRLEERLDKVNGMLQTALQALGLDISSSIEASISRVVRTTKDTQSCVEDISRNLVHVSQRLEQAVYARLSYMELQLAQNHTALGTGINSSTERMERAVAQLEASMKSQSLQSQVIEPARSAQVTERAVEFIGRRLPPATLRTLCDRFETQRAVIAACDTAGGCTCVRRRIRRRKQFRSCGSIFMFTETDVVEKHWPSCRLATLPAARHSRTFGLQSNGLRGLFSGLVNFSFSTTSGSGGFSLSPKLAYYPVVDPACSPTVRIVGLIRTVLWYSMLPQVALALFCETALDRIVQAFKVRLASPIDVNYDGKTLLHLAAGLMDQHSSPDQIAVASGIMDGLLMCGVPVNHLDLHGNTALAYVDPSAMVSAETMLLKHNAEAWYGDLTLALKYLLYEALGSSRIVASAHGIGPLSFAIVQGNKLLVEQILNVRPSALLEEVDNTGYTPLHLAVMNPSILEILLQREDSAKIINKANTTGDLPIHYALYFVQTTESIHSADLLLRAGSFCPLWPYGMLEQPAILSSAAWRMLLSHLKRRRLRLKKLALETLSKEDIRRLKLDSLGIPDARADDVVATLLANNVKVPAELGGSELSLTYRSSSVYFYIRHPNIADLAFSLGFRDVDSYNFAGLSPLIHHAIRRFYRPYFDWLVAHGADLHGVPSPAVALDWPDVNLHATAAHWVAGAIANGVGVLVEDWSDGTRNVINEIMALDLADNCDCWCSEKGCTPFLIFWKTLWGRITPGRHETLVNFSYLLRRHFQARMSPSQHRSLVRFLTFERLGLRHTCCVFRKSHKDDLYPYSEPICSHRYMSKEEVEEIHDEDREMLKLLEDLLADFKRELCSGVSLTGFLERLWTPRMQDVLRTLEARRLASEEIEAAEKIGVVWDTARMSNSHSYGPDPPEPESDEEDDEDTVEYWMAKLDEILPPETSDRR